MKKLADYFRPIMTRPVGRGAHSARKLTDDAPEWLRNAILAAHSDGADLPRDWIYEECEAACCRIDDGVDDDGEWIHKHADSRVDVYTRQLYDWAAVMCHSTVYALAKDRAEDYGAEGSLDPERVIAFIQYCAIAQIAETIFQAWKGRDDETK